MNNPWKTGAVVLVGLASIAATCALGVWQLHRAAGKEALQQEIDAAARAAPVAPDADALTHPDALAHRHLRFAGRWVPEHVVYLDNRPENGRAGFYVMMALRIEQPLAREILVNRGWMQRDATDRARIGAYETPTGPVEVSGVALADEPRLLELAAPGARPLSTIWQNFDFDAYARASGQTPVRVVLRQDANAQPDGLSRDWPDRGGALQSQIDRHHGYAFQWFALAATIAVLLLYRAVRTTRPVRPPTLEADL